MKVVIAIDSFKGSLTSTEAGLAAKEGVLATKPDADVIVRPAADGGEGTVDAFIQGLNAERVNITVTGPFHERIPCYYGYLKEKETAVIEMASAAGITLTEKRDPMNATTYGVGEMILDALTKGCRDFIIGIGGSVTNDGGIGMLKALGTVFLDKNSHDVGEGGQALDKVHTIDISGLNPFLKDCRFHVACDVTNPLCGKNGATFIYGLQKGVTRDMAPKLDQAIAHYAQASVKALGFDHTRTSGAGAAGGLGFALLSYLHASITPGISLILDAVGLEKELPDTDIVITGEGRIDSQTAMGKVPSGVAGLAKKYGVKTIAFAGSVTSDASVCNKAGIDAFFPIVRGATTLHDAMKPENAKENMRMAVEQVFRLL